MKSQKVTRCLNVPSGMGWIIHHGCVCVCMCAFLTAFFCEKRILSMVHFWKSDSGWKVSKIDKSIPKKEQKMMEVNFREWHVSNCLPSGTHSISDPGRKVILTT